MNNVANPQLIQGQLPTMDLAEKTRIAIETFRKQPGVARSINATHSLAAIGPMAEEIIRDHELLDAPPFPVTYIVSVPTVPGAV